MRGKRSLVVLLAISILAACLTMADAEPISVAITAEVATVDDPGGFLSGAINVGDIITGMYVYESTTPDANPLLTVGDYLHTTSSFGITLNAGGSIFRTDPNNVSFLVEIVNDHGTPPRDNYLLRSYNNIFDVSAPPDPLGQPADNHIAWQLDDPTSAALSSVALPTLPPVLTDWQSFFGLTIESRNLFGDFFNVRAHVTSAELINSCPDADGDGYAVCATACDPGGKLCGDCNDNNASINPGAVENCINAVDDNCDGLVDMTDSNCQIPCSFNAQCFASTNYCQKDRGACGSIGVCKERPEICVAIWIPVCGCDGRTYGNDCEAAQAGVNVLHAGGCAAPCPDADRDGYAVCTPTCDPTGKLCGDCNDNNALIKPNSTEICDGMDNNCNGLTDEGFDKDGDGYTVCENDCNDSNPNSNPGAMENCKDGIDNDCDDLIDRKDPDCRKKR